MNEMPYLYYILDGKEVKVIDTLEEWAKARYDEDAEGRLSKTKSWIVKQETVNGKFVSTVFLGMDHGWGEGPPLVFETMIFPETEGDNAYLDEYCEHYSTWEEAEAGHKKAVELCMTSQEEPKLPVENSTSLQESPR